MAREKDKLTKHTMWLREGDFAKLAEMYPDLGSSLIVRKLVSTHIDKIEAQLAQDEAQNIEVKL